MFAISYMDIKRRRDDKRKGIIVNGKTLIFEKSQGKIKYNKVKHHDFSFFVKRVNGFL